MFVELAALLKSCQKLNISVFPSADGKLKLAVVPTPLSNSDSALTTPLVLVGTPADLDAGLADAIGAYTNAHIQLADQVASTTAILADAKEKSSTKAVKALSKSDKKESKAGSQTSTSDEDADEDEDEDKDGEKGILDSSTPKVPANSEDDLLSILQGGQP